MSAGEVNGMTAAKRPRRSAVPASKPGRKSAVHRPKIFQPFRALGLITDSVPFVLRVRHGGKDADKPDIQVLTCIGTSWLMWDADRMTLQFVGEPLERNITSLILVSGSGGRDSILATSGRAVYRFVRGRLQDVLAIEDDSDEKGDLQSLLSVGDNVIALSSQGDAIYIWSILAASFTRRIDLARPIIGTSKTFLATCMLHPSTYVDKLLLGGASGDLQLFNFRTSTLLHTFSCESLLEYMGLSTQEFNDSDDMRIVDLVQTPAIDVVAVVFALGYILLLDIRYDEPILYGRVGRDDRNLQGGSILGRSSVTFRNDGVAHTMAVGTALGDIVLFDLEHSGASKNNGDGGGKRARPAQVAHSVRAAHDASVTSVQFLQGQPLLLSSGADNALKQWFFEADTVSGSNGLGGNGNSLGMTAPPRLLKSREGHSSPPRIIRYIGEGGKTIISAGGDDRSVRAVSVVRDSRSAELSQGSLRKKANKNVRSYISMKLPPATSIAHSSTRTRDWDDLVTTHTDTKYAQSWSTRNARIGSHHLQATTGGKGPLTSVATTAHVSACGNFSIVGNELGYAEMYNIQSSRYRSRFDTRGTRTERVAKKLKAGGVRWTEESIPLEGSAVTGIASDSVNHTVVLTTADGFLHFFDFHTSALTKSVRARAGITAALLHRPTNLLAAKHEDNTISMYDMESFKHVRLFAGFGDIILDMTFSPDGRWLVASCADGFVRTFDIPTSRLVDFFSTAQAAVSLTFSPLGDFLATIHEGSRGIYLWANRNQYLNLPLSGIDEAEVLKAGEVKETLPTLRGLDIEALDEEDLRLKEMDVGEAEYQRTYTSKPQLFVSGDVQGDEDDTRESAGLLTLSTMPRSRWMTLLNLDVIKARNKAKVTASEKPERAPFFLPNIASSVPDSAVKKARSGFMELQDGDEEFAQPRHLKTLAMEGLDYESDFARRLEGALQDNHIDALFLFLHALSPPALDAEIRSLTRLQDITRFLQCMTHRLRQHLDYDAVQAMVAVALRVHGDTIVANGVKKAVENEGEESDDEVEDEGVKLAEAFRALMAEQYREGNRLLDLVQYCMGSLAFVRDIPLV